MFAVEARGVGKRYTRLRRWRISDTIRDRLRSDVRAAKALRRPDFWALKDVSIDVEPGEAVGIIGNNGAGKSTMLKLIAGVTYPTLGYVKVRGRVGALIDVAAGMHPELSGHENVYLYGSLLGLRRREIRDKFETIVDFSEIHDFLDVAVKRYSSGMRIRLGFAVAAHLDPDILLVDEVLAVGDAAFQRKCLDRIQTLVDAGTTIVFVSHDLFSVERICRRVLWIENGSVREDGDAAEVIRHYRAAIGKRIVQMSGTRGNESLRFGQVVLTDANGQERTEFSTGEALVVRVDFQGPETPMTSDIAIKIVDETQTTVAVAHTDHGPAGLHLQGQGSIQCVFEHLPLAARAYQVWGQVISWPSRTETIPWQPLAAFAVRGSARSTYALQHSVRGRDLPLIEIPTRWVVDGGRE